jgi:hypothetical protein
MSSGALWGQGGASGIRSMTRPRARVCIGLHTALAFRLAPCNEGCRSKRGSFFCAYHAHSFAMQPAVRNKQRRGRLSVRN